MGINYLKDFIIVVFIGFFGFLFPFYLTEGSLSALLLLFYSIAFYSTLRLGIIMYKNKIKLMEMTFFIFVYVFLGIAPIMQIYYQDFPWHGFYAASSISTAAFTIWIGIIAYELGLWLGNRGKTIVTNGSNDINLKFLVLVGIVCFFFSVMGLGGFTNLGEPRLLSSTTSLLYTSLLRVPVFIALVASLIYWINRGNKNFLIKSNFGIFLMIVFLIILNIIASNPMYTSRYWFGTVIIGIVFILIKWRKLTIPLIVSTILFGILIIFPYADVYRDKGEFKIETRDFATNLTSGDFDAFQQIMNTHLYTEIEGYSFGKQFLGAAFFWVPRSIWTDKPIGTGAMVAKGLGYDFTNLSAPLWVEFYINFGNLGVLIGFILYGVLTARIQNNFIRTKGKVNFYQFFVPIFSMYQIFLLRGDLLSSFAYLVPVIVFILLGLRVKVLRKKLVLTNV